MVLGQDVDRGGGCVCEQKEYIGTLLSVQHCCEPTTARKIKFINKWKKEMPTKIAWNYWLGIFSLLLIFA